MGLRAALLFGVVCAAVGFAVGLWFLSAVGWVVLPILVVGAICVLTYTDLLARMGIGELAAGLGLGGLPVIGTALVQDGTLGAAAWAAAIPATFMTFNLLLLNEFPDQEADRRGGRRNLVLLLGRRPAALLYLVAALLVPVSLIVSALLGHLPFIALLAVLPSLLLIQPGRWAVRESQTEVPIPALGANVIWILATNALLAAGLFLAAG